MEEKKRKRRIISRIPRMSLIAQVAIFFLVGLMITGWISYSILKRQYKDTVQEQKEQLAQHVIYDIVNDLLKQYSFIWLLEYWSENYGIMDVEYMARTPEQKKKAEALQKNHPEMPLEQITGEMVKEEFNEHEQRMFAEFFYARDNMSFDNVITTYNMEGVYLILVDPDFSSSTVLFCGGKIEYNAAENRISNNRQYQLGDSFPVSEEMSRNLEETWDYYVGGDGEGEAVKVKMYTSEGHIQYFVPIIELDSGKRIFVYESFDLDTYLNEIKTDARRGVGYLLLFQLILTAICLGLLIFFVLRPIRRTRIAVRHYTADKDCEAVLAQLKKVCTGNEIGDLKDDLSDMIYEMDQYMKEIRHKTAEKERISTELSVATKIQADMLPKKFPAFPDRKDFDVYATMTPAKEVGGDFYDFFLIDDDHLALVIADVSGKGVPAALFMVISRTLLRNRAMMGGTPSEILEDVNHQLCDGNDSGYFVTVWLAIIQLSTGKGVAANAGHEHPALRRKDGSFEMVKYRHSPALATMDGLPFRQHDFQLEPGDRLYVYTDGVTEATDSGKQLFGEDRMLDALNHKADSTLQELLHGVKDEIDSFVGEAVQFDDITMLAMDYTPQ